MNKVNILAVSSALIVLSTSILFAGLSVSPARQEVTLPANAVYSGTYTVRNDFAAPASIHVNARDWFVLPENRHISSADWLSVSPAEFSLLPGESKTIKYSVHVPSSAVGSLISMVSFVPETEQESGLTLVVSVSLYVTVDGTEKNLCDLSNTTITQQQNKIRVSAQVSNKGNIHIRPTGTVTLLKDKETIGIMNFAESRPVYPGASRVIVADIDKAVLKGAGTYSAELAVDCGAVKKTGSIRFAINNAGEIVQK